MWPILKEEESWVQLALPDGSPIGKGDIVLYRRKDGTLVLHRIVRLSESGTYMTCGDHQWEADEWVTDEQILAVAQGFFRKGHYIDERTWWYRLYQKIWNGNLMVRRCCLALLRLSGLEKRNIK